ncbi:MAG: putative glycoside hydrolase, partial [Patescibacteria group bacterium]
TTTPAIYTKRAFDRKKLRQWLQDFSYPVTYTPEMVRTQIQATYDSGLTSWMLWDPGNKYTVSALDKQ